MDYNFGERSIGFRIVPKDPRRDKRYSDSWKEAPQDDPRWQYDEAAMKQSVFDCMLARFPLPAFVTRLTAEWDEEKTRETNLRDAIILDNQDDLALLRIINKVDFGCKQPESEPQRLVSTAD